MDKLHSILAELGGNPMLQGFEIACDCIQAMIEEPDLKKQLLKRLYPRIGEKYGISYHGVDRNIRVMLEHMQIRQDYFERLKKVGMKYHATFLLQQFSILGGTRPKEFMTTIAAVLGDTWNEEAEVE
jgi:hypothetical protein